MPHSNIEPLLISVPYGSTHDRVSSPRYHYQNDRRGNEEFVIIQHTESGCGEFTIGEKRLPVPTGHAFIAIVPEASTYSYPEAGAEPWTFSWLNLYGPLGLQLSRAFRDAFGPVVPLSPRSPAGGLFLSLVEAVTARPFPDQHALSTRAYQLLMEWSRQLVHPAHRKGDPIETALAICRSRFREPIGVKELAGMSGLSREHFTRLFSAHTGVSPALYLRRLRAAAAREMIEEGRVTLSEVALRSGFPSLKALHHGLSSTASSLG